ncbi:hypothetical protein [Lihuaxuella thermophila]|uniref:Uncharacterized protein n=1 Tax=Lihuaxuella thermophila TaxID=1173111 RepID=A0A1H8ITG9_9BACL|nr:hypothetical protein [Lihuaxuella thermophila]SEN71701.1 hypothetical protein SAMN05444955_11945 [Lihuaxuella thermophila]
MNDAELEMAAKLIEEISGAFRDDYKSNYEEALKELIEPKSRTERWKHRVNHVSM